MRGNELVHGIRMLIYAAPLSRTLMPTFALSYLELVALLLPVLPPVVARHVSLLVFVLCAVSSLVRSRI